MAINVYTGLQGSGKSYEVVSSVILTALAAGRRVVTNVANLQLQAIYDYCVLHHKVEPAAVGTIVQLSNDDLLKPNFFPVEGSSLPSIVLAGDLVVIDECWRWWSVTNKLPPAHMTFFRMHRHFAHAVTGVTCDLVLVVQDITDLNKQLKVVVENVYRMTKHKALGTNKHYRVDVYQGHKVLRNPTMSYQKKYDPAIFELYKSYSQSTTAAGSELVIDNRANIFKGSLFKLILPISLLVGGFAFYNVYRFFNPKVDKQTETNKQAKGKSTAGTPTAAVTPLSSSSSFTVRPENNDSTEWKTIGYYKVGSDLYVTLANNTTRRILVNPTGFYLDRLRVTGQLDGKQVTNYTGAAVDTLLPIK